MVKEKKSQPPTSKTYAQIRHGWVKDKNAFIAMQRNFFVLLSITAMFGVVIAMIVIKSMVEKNAIEPYVISVNTADKMPVAISSQSIKQYADANSAVIEFFLTKYIKAREGYYFGTYKEDYNNTTRAMSNYSVYKQFRQAILGDDKNNPAKIFGENGRVEVVIKQIAHNPKTSIATIRIAKKVFISDALRQILNYQIKIHYILDTSNLKASDIEVNPLGLTVDTYEVTEEKTIIEDETFLR